MTRPKQLLQVVLALQAKTDSIDKLNSKQCTLIIKEFHRLKSLLQKHAQASNNPELFEWVNGEQERYIADRLKANEEMAALGEAWMKIRPADTFEEMIARAQHADKIAELTERKTRLHIEFIQGMNARLKAKVEALGIGIKRPS
jgi:hypothetical protein